MPVALEMGWRHLLFESWPVEPETLEAHLPNGLVADVHDDRAWLSVTPFTNVDLRPRGFPRWLGIDLPEINVRTYVRRESDRRGDGRRGDDPTSSGAHGEPGVYFFSLDAASVASVFGARLTHHLPYFYARASLRTTGDGVRFASRRRHPGARAASYAATYRAIGEPFAASEDPLASFLTERYRLYTEAADGTLRHTDVEHEPWTLYPASATVTTNTMLEASGLPAPDAEPIRYYSPGVDVVARPSERVKPRSERIGAATVRRAPE